MRMPHVDDLVRLTQDIPELELARGEIGIVRSTWCSPQLAYEVEFNPPGQNFHTRCLLAAEQVQVQEEVVGSWLWVVGCGLFASLILANCQPASSNQLPATPHKPLPL